MADYGDVNNCFFPKDLYYSVENNTWTRLNDDGTVTIGMTDIAQTLAGSVLHATPQRVGKKRKLGKPVAIVESSKWVGPVKSPIVGEVVESNDNLKTDPGLLNKSPYKQGWIVKMKADDLEANLAALVTGDAAVELYRKKIEDEGIDACVHCEGYEIQPVLNFLYNIDIGRMMSIPLDAKLFTHPACSCGPTIELVKKIIEGKDNFAFKEISLKTADGRKEAAQAGVKIIPTLFFIKSNVLLVTSKEITEETIENEINKLIK